MQGDLHYLKSNCSFLLKYVVHKYCRFYSSQVSSSHSRDFPELWWYSLNLTSSLHTSGLSTPMRTPWCWFRYASKVVYMSFKDDLPRYNDPLPYKADTFLFTKRKPLESSARLIGGTKALVKALVDFSSIESDQRHQIIYTTPWGETSNHCWCSMGRKISINGFVAR